MSSSDLVYSRFVRLLPFAVLLFLLCACGSQSHAQGQPGVVRQPTARERAGIIAAAKERWKYESGAGIYARQHHIPPSHLHPKVVSIRVSRVDPRIASAVVELRDARGRLKLGTAIFLAERFDKNSLPSRTGSWSDVVPAASAFPVACTAATPKGLRDLLCPDPWSVLDYPRPSVKAKATYVKPISSPDLHKVDWANIALPGAVCGATQPIRLHDGEAAIRYSSFEPWWNVVVVYGGLASYGDLNGDGKDEAAVDVVCSNDGGTADGQLAFADVIFGSVGKSLRVIGIITPRQPFSLRTPHVPLLGKPDIRRGKVIAYEGWYGPNDGTCCPSGQAKTIWTYANGALRASRTSIMRKPSRR